MKAGIIAIAALAILATLQPAAAQRLGIAIVEAPEQSSGMCFADNLDRGFDCARAECVAGGAESRDCLRVAWCYPARWSADVFLQSSEGFHWHEYLCGWATREAVEAAVRVKCEEQGELELIECAMVRLWDEGEEIAFE
ncbi:hypothetical protein GRZ55_05520 [Chelativorans sp. ZYF759]|uniref:hypothetical protein n=1 Tax=Chelativorans sp. ZYF759 TaxID=2692213 RepID=UPI00145F7AD2|nr:hypothetical protein [Chelativorans sp. ZYF759]NMG38699.1 hypothetical protein [Chelativorans sp. ZYF759]